MFALSNLARHGLAGGHPRAMTFWLDRTEAPVAALGVTEDGMVMPLWPDAFDAALAVPHLRDRPLIGLSGPAGPVRALMAAAALTAAHDGLNADEPQFALTLDRLVVPTGPGVLAPLSAAREIAVAWRRSYADELRMPAGSVAEVIGDFIETDSHRLLMVDGEPVAMTGWNARHAGTVQVGGVYVPPALRGRGLARRAAGLHLAALRAEGIAQATLFAVSDAAAACYRAIGFERIGTYALVFLAGAAP